MPTLQRMLIAYDSFSRNEPLPSEALEFAHRYGAAVRVVHVVDATDGSGWKARSSRPLADRLGAPQLIGERQRALQGLIDEAGANDFVESVLVRQGVAHIEIIREAMEWGADLVVVPDSPLHRGDVYGFGTVTMKLFRKCPTPVLALRHDHLLADSRILACIDLTDGGLELNRRVVGWGRTIAGATGDLSVLHAWELWGQDLRRSHAVGKEVNGVVREAEEVARARFEEVLAEIGDAAEGVNAMLENGPARLIIPKVVESQKFDVVVMGSVARTGLRGVLIGNTAEKILNRLAASVLAVKPPGFVSPVEPARPPAVE